MSPALLSTYFEDLGFHIDHDPISDAVLGVEDVFFDTVSMIETESTGNEYLPLHIHSVM